MSCQRPRNGFTYRHNPVAHQKLSQQNSVNQARLIKTLLARYGIGAMLSVLAGIVVLVSTTLNPKLVNPSYNLPFINCGVPHLEPKLIKPTEVTMVYLDDDSHRELKQPYNTSWDRAMYARLLDRLTADGARAVVFDILFTDPHPTKPEGDVEFARAIKANGKVILGAEFTLTADGSPTVIRAIDLFLDAAADWGIVQFQADQDFMVRRHLHVPSRDADDLSSLSWQTAHWLGVPEAQNPKNRFKERWMNYYGPPGTIPGISFHRALETNQFCPPGFFSNKVVFVGANLKTYFSGQRKDEYINPYTVKGEFIPGVEVQATQFLNLLRHDWLTRWSPFAENMIVLVAGLVLGIGLARFRPLTATGLVAQ